MKKKLITFGVLAFVVLVLSVLNPVSAQALGAKEKLSKSAEQFLSFIGSGDKAGAYDLTAKKFQAQISRSAFDSQMQEINLAQYKEVSWKETSIEKNVGKLSGMMQTKEGKVVPISMALVNEGDEWKVINVMVKWGVENFQEAKIPREELTKLVKTTMQNLGEGVAKEDFSDFHRSLSTVLQKEMDPNRLKIAFREFIEMKMTVDVRQVVQNESPTFIVKPTFDRKNNILMLKGYYSAGQRRLNFLLNYINEESQWKLRGISAGIR